MNDKLPYLCVTERVWGTILTLQMCNNDQDRVIGLCYRV